MKIKCALTVALALLLCGFSLTAQAADFRYSTEQNGSATINAADSPKDLHVVAPTVAVTANVSGDLLAAGNNVTVSGDVENSSFIAGATVSSTGKVGHHLRVAGNDVTISGTITGDLFVAGQNVTIDTGAVINGSAYLAGTNVVIKGAVKGGAWVRASNVTLSGSAGSLHAQATTVSLQDKAVITGDFVYSSPTTAAINATATVTGQTLYTQTNQPKFLAVAEVFTATSLLMLLGAMLLLFLIGLLWPTTSRRIVENVTTHSFRLFWVGLLSVFITPVLLIITLVTVVGIPAALLVGALWLVTLMLGSLFAQLTVGSWIISQLTRSGERPIDWQAAVVGVLSFALLGLIPFVGSFIIFVLTVVGTGAVVSQFGKTERTVI